MSKSRKRKHFLEDSQLGIMGGIRKKMPPPTKVMPNLKDIQKQQRWDWRDELANLNDDDSESEKK